MKKYILLLSFCLSMFQSFCQLSQNSPKTKEYFLKESRTQKTVAYVFLGAGVAAIVVGAAVSGNAPKKPDLKGLAYTGVGLLSCIVSIPFFIISKQSSQKAAQLSLSNQPVLIPSQAGLTSAIQPAVSLKITLGW